MLKFIVAKDEKGGIGYKGNMLVHNSRDLKRFKDLTMGHYVLMGRKTYESIPKELKGRKELVLTSNPPKEYHKVPYSYIDNVEYIIDLITSPEEVVWVIGGGEVYRYMWNKYRKYITELHITIFPNNYIADTYFNIDFSLEEPKFNVDTATIIYGEDIHLYSIWKRELNLKNV